MKIAAQITITVEKCLAMALSSTRYCDSTGSVSLPSKVWEDKYIAAFTHHLVGLFVKYEFDGKSWPQKKRDTVFMMVLENLCGNNSDKLVSNVEEGVSAPEYKHEFERAISDAASLYLAATNQLESSDETPVIREARQALIAANKGRSGEMNLSGIDLAPTICALTIGRRVREKHG